MAPIPKGGCVGEKGGLPLYVLVNFHEPSEQSRLCGMLRTWMELNCVSMDIITAEKPVLPMESVIVFWDLDGPELPPVPQGQSCALFLCSRDPQRAVDSYAFHPDGFLTKPVTIDQLWNAMLRCANLWFGSLLRLELLSERVKVGIPFRNLVWAEGTRRGCLIHTPHQTITIREALYQLEERLPETIFARCQRSFVVNFNHVQEITGGSLILSDGTELSLSRGSKAHVLEAYRRFCQLRYGGGGGA